MALLYIKNIILPAKRQPVSLPSFKQQQQYGTCDTASEISQDGSDSSTLRSDTGNRSSSRVDPRIISDATIGLSDGLTVPFALCVGLAALGDTKLVIYAGLAELCAGAISMGLGGYLGGTRKIVNQAPDEANSMIKSTFDSYGLSEDTLDAFATQISSCPKRSENFIMRFHHDLPESQADASRAYISALTIALGYLLGGLVPLTPYFFVSNNQTALCWSIGVMAVALFVFGYVKTVLVGEEKRLLCVKAGIQMMVLGGVAAGAAMGCVKAIGS
ncbi:unnamed protein product [Aureobasidium uvarum]|uniref:DUF125-domain-containing protein n=1 Tax=Aureobasidium uvarum TaxID=2773716 RepID=A0A9N8KNF8_9PEZI|nr:unnamed protein product [Aureobasidium uvarum]